MDHRAFFGICVSAFIFAACSDDETAPATQSDGSGGAANTGGGSGSGTGGNRNTGGSNTGTGGRATGTGGANPGGTGGATGGGGGATPDGGDASTGTGGTGGATSTGGASNTGGANNTGGTAPDGSTPDGATTDGGGPCSALSTCCASLTGRRRGACENIATGGDAASCTAVTDLYCGDGGAGPGGDAGGSDAFVNCTALATCCSALADGGRQARLCDRVAATGNNATCNRVAADFCN